MRADWLATMPHLVARSTSNRGIFDGRDGTEADLIRFWFRFQSDAAKIQIPLRVVWGFRTHEEQTALLARGVTRAKAGQSAHNYGRALDIIHMTRAWDGMPSEGWEILGIIGKEAARKVDVQVEWGGDWQREKRGGLGWDPAHWQLKHWRSNPFPI